MDKKTERRYTGDCRLRTVAAEGEARPKIAGYAAVFDTLSEELWGFRERIARSAFQPALARSDIRALLNHDPNFVLGRTRNDTLRVWEDARGLAVEVDPPATAWAADLLVSIDRGDISQMSFAFRVGEDKWETVDDENLRTILSFEQIFDVSPVTFPAYPDTNVALRAGLGPAGIDIERLAGAIVRAERRMAPQPGDAAVIEACIRVLESSRATPQERSLSRLRRRLRILELENSIEEAIR